MPVCIEPGKFHTWIDASPTKQDRLSGGEECIVKVCILCGIRSVMSSYRTYTYTPKNISRTGWCSTCQRNVAGRYGKRSSDPDVCIFCNEPIIFPPVRDEEPPKETYAPWDAAEFLTDDKTITEYLKAAIEENDLEFFMRAFKEAIRAYEKNKTRENIVTRKKGIRDISEIAADIEFKDDVTEARALTKELLDIFLRIRLRKEQVGLRGESAYRMCEELSDMISEIELVSDV